LRDAAVLDRELGGFLTKLLALSFQALDGLDDVFTRSKPLR